MPKIIETKEEAGNMSVFEFKIYLSPKDKKTILGYLAPFGIRTGERIINFTSTNIGIAAKTAFIGVLKLAERYKIPFVWVNDPKKLFPPGKRSTT